MRLPRGVSGQELARLLGKVGYRPIRQSGSHMRLFREDDPKHRITIPMRSNLRVGTLNRILTDIAARIEIGKAELVEQLWAR